MQAPKDTLRTHAARDVDVTWLLQQLSDTPAETLCRHMEPASECNVCKHLPSGGATGQAQGEQQPLRLCFSIDRSAEKCKTPRRNEQVQKGADELLKLQRWANDVQTFFVRSIFTVVKPTSESGADKGRGHGLDLGAIGKAAEGIFVPVLPLFEDRSAPEAAAAADAAAADADLAGMDSGVATVAGFAGEDSAAVLNLGDMNKFLAEQRRSMAEQLASLKAAFPAADGAALISAAEATMLTGMQHMSEIVQHFCDGMDYIECMLRTQLVAAIGKQVTLQDFNQYMLFHDTKLYREEYAPQPFCFAVRRPEHYPEGTVSIESRGDKGLEPIYTMRRQMAEPVPRMTFRLDAATNVDFTGERFLHGYVTHQFGGGRSAPLSLVARARQFSCFMLVIGKLGSATTFQPKHALILQNKDELNIPLMLEQLPTPKAFRDAVESLSPEQQRFAKAYRGMQLEGSVFGLMVVQLKPQLETLLNLEEDSLTKEIKLTQTLLTLFMDYQIPSDLLSFDGDASLPAAEKLAAVKEHVAAIDEMIAAEKAAEVEASKQQYAYDSGGAPPPPSAAAFGSAQPEMMSAQPAFGAPAMRSAGFGSMQRGGGGGGGGGFGGGGPRMKKSMSRNAEPRVMASTAARQPAMMMESAPMEHDAMAYSADAAPSKTPQQSAGQPQQPEGEGAAAEGGAVDFTQIPAALDKKFEALDEDACLRATTIEVGETWSKKAKKALLAKATTRNMNAEQQRAEKDNAFDLLDALSRSGSLSLNTVALHVMVAATHNFERSLMDVIIQDSVNPIEKVERSSLIVASTIADCEVSELIKPAQLERLQATNAKLLGA